MFGLSLGLSRSSPRQTAKFYRLQAFLETLLATDGFPNGENGNRGIRFLPQISSPAFFVSIRCDEHRRRFSSTPARRNALRTGGTQPVSTPCQRPAAVSPGDRWGRGGYGSSA